MPFITQPSIIVSSNQIAPGIIVNSDINASAAIDESKLAFAANDGSRHDHHADDITGGTLSVTRGGTGVSNPTTGNLLLGAGASAMTPLAGSAAGQVVKWSGSAWQAGSSPAGLEAVKVSDTNHTGNTNETTLFTGAIPAGAMGANGMMHIVVAWNAANDGGGAGTQTLRIKYGGTEFVSHSRSSTSGAQAQISECWIQNENNAAVQTSHSIHFANDGTSPSLKQFNTEQTGAVNSATALDVTVTGQLSNSSHHIEVNNVTVEVFNKA